MIVIAENIVFEHLNVTDIEYSKLKTLECTMPLCNCSFIYNFHPQAMPELTKLNENVENISISMLLAPHPNWMIHRKITSNQNKSKLYLPPELDSNEEFKNTLHNSSYQCSGTLMKIQPNVIDSNIQKHYGLVYFTIAGQKGVLKIDTDCTDPTHQSIASCINQENFNNLENHIHETPGRDLFMYISISKIY